MTRPLAHLGSPRRPLLAGLAALAVTGITVAAIAFAPLGNRAAAGVATLWVQGAPVQTLKADGRNAAAGTGERLSAGDAVSVDQAGRALIRFDDGSTVELEAGATLRLVSASPAAAGNVIARLEQSAGRTLVDARTVSGARSTIEVKTPAATARGEGAAFSVALDGENAIVRGVRGTVAFGTRTVFPEMESHASIGAGASLPTPVRPRPGVEFVAKNASLTVIDPQLRLARGFRRVDVDGEREEDRVYLGLHHFDDPAAVGQYTIVARSGDGGDVTLDLIGLFGISLTQGLSRAVRLPPGGTARATVRVSLDPSDRVVFADSTALVPVGSACEAEIPGRAFGDGTLEHRARDLAAFAGDNSGKRVGLILSGLDLASVAQAASTDAGSWSLDAPAVSIDADGLHLAARTAFGPLPLSTRADFAVVLLDSAPAVRVSGVTVQPFAALFADRFASQLEQSMSDGLRGLVSASRIRWDRVTLHAGCVGLLGSAP